jgi:hypothetical protein
MGAWYISSDSVVCCFQLKMEARRTRQLPIGNTRQIKAQDIKLWEQDEVQAHATQQERYRCPCQICHGVHPLK